jgi:hypothetical protein
MGNTQLDNSIRTMNQPLLQSTEHFPRNVSFPLEQARWNVSLLCNCCPFFVLYEYRIRMEGTDRNVSVNMYHFMRINNEVTGFRGFFHAVVMFQTYERIAL